MNNWNRVMSEDRWVWSSEKLKSILFKINGVYFFYNYLLDVTASDDCEINSGEGVFDSLEEAQYYALNTMSTALFILTQEVTHAIIP